MHVNQSTATKKSPTAKVSKTGLKILAMVAAAGIGLGACGSGGLEINEVSGTAPAQAVVAPATATEDPAPQPTPTNPEPVAVEEEVTDDPTVDDNQYSDQDIALVEEDDLLDHEQMEADLEDDDLLLGDGWYVENDLFGFIYQLEAGFEASYPATGELVMGEEHVHTQTGVAVRVYGEYETVELGDLSGFVQVFADGAATREVPEYLTLPIVADDNLLIRGAVDLGTHIIVVEVEGSDHNSVWDTHQSVMETLFIQDREPLAYPA